MHSLVFQLDFDRAHRDAVRRGLVAAVLRRPNCLVSYREARRGATGAESYRGVRSVAIDRIVGSVDRADDFDRTFLPRRRHSAGRWQRVARAHVEGIDLPPVQLYEIDGAYFVQDGHHRISVARRYGQEFIEAEVTAALVSRPSEARPQPRSTPSRRLTACPGALVRGLSPRPLGAEPAAVAVPGGVRAACACS